VAISLLEMIQLPSRRNDSGPLPPFERYDPVPLPVICDGLKATISPKSTALLSVLLDRLDGLVNTKDLESADIIFAQQSIMETLLHFTQSPSQLQIDVLVKLIQALALVANLAPLSTDSILHHLMPIVISTGSFLSPRDDVYSVKVGEKYSRKEELFMAEFMVPVCLLLVEIDTPSDGNNRRQESRTDLAVQILRSQPFESRMIRISDLLEAIVLEILSHPPQDSTFIASLREDSNVGVDIRTTNIIELVDKVLHLSNDTTRPEPTEASQRILSALLRLLANVNSRPSTIELQSLRELLVTTLSSALRVVSAPTMISTCIQLLRTHDNELQIELYKLISSRVQDIDLQIRESLTADMRLIIVNIKETLATSQDGHLCTAALMALTTLARSSCPPELSTLTEVVPAVIDKLLISPRTSISALESLWYVLLHLRLAIVAEDVAAIASLLLILLESTSSFWTSIDSQHLISFCINSARIIDPDNAVSSLGKFASKRLPTSTLLAAIVDLWKNRKENLLHGVDANEQLFSLLRQVIKAGDRVGEWNNWIGSQTTNINKVSIADGAPSIQAFLELVVKLNETSFKPLYRILFDWAWYIGDGLDGLYEFRARAFCQVMKSLTSLLKALITPYLSNLLEISPEILSRWTETAGLTNFELWKSFLQLLVQTTTIDDNGLWRDEHIRKLIPSLVQQIRFIASWQRPWMLDQVCEVFGAVGITIHDITLLRMLLIETLLITREDEAAIQKCALECVHSLWLANSHRTSSWKVEIMPFLHECAEAENDE
ncbi:1431_t:CDS:10, partial [Acaulospora colombiana]